MGYNPRFVVPGGFRCTVTPLYTTIEASAKLVISAFFAVFIGNNPRFVVPGGFSMHGDPLYTIIEASVKLVISAIFWRFRGL